MGGQIRALIALKIALIRNTWSMGRLVSLIVVLFLSVAGVAAAIAAGVGGYYAGWLWLGPQEPMLVMLVLDGVVVLFCFLWFWSLAIEIQRADVIDFRKMLFFPVSMRLIFTMNFISSLLSPALVLFLPGLMGLLAGLCMRRGTHMLFSIPLGLAFYLMFAAWAYYIRGKVAILMENKRRRRFILTLLPVSMAILFQVPNLFMHTLRDNEQLAARMKQISPDQAHAWAHYANMALPIGWLPYGTSSLMSREDGVAWLCFMGLLGFGGAGLLLGYHSTLRFYLGELGVRTRRKVTNEKGRMPATGCRIPLLADDTSALTAAAFLGYLRHPNIRILLIMPPVMAFFFLIIFRTGPYAQWSGGGAWLPAAVLVWPFFNFTMVFFNIFGIDQQGFRGMVLLPAPRYKYILAKNVALFPFAGGMSLLFVAGGALLVHVPARSVCISMVLALQLYLAYCLIGNFVSLYFPYRIGRDTMRAHGNRPILFLVGLFSAVLVAILMLPAAFCMMLDGLAETFWGIKDAPVGFLVAIGLLALTALAYAFALVHAGDVLLAREQRILARLVKDRE